MSRSAPYLGILAALVIGFLAAVTYQGITYVSSPVIVSVATSTTPAPPAPIAPVVATTTGAAPKKIPHETPPPSPTKVSFDAAAVVLLKALVNIICIVPPKSNLHSISASGVIIDPKGIILTNAHVAQYFLLADRGVVCTIRTGNPAAIAYKAALAYISPFWITTNSDELIATDPTGTGQYDFALLAITESATATSLPAPFSYAPLARIAPELGTPVALASYGAHALSTSQIEDNLRPTLTLGSVKDIFTFDLDTVDVVALGGSAAAQEGSSGGGAVNALGKLVATITTSSIDGDTNTRSLHAITASYIRSEYAAETGQSLDVLLSQPTTTTVAAFAPRIPALESFITARLP